MDDLKNKKKHNDKRRDIPWNVKFTQRYVVEFDSLQHKIDDDEAQGDECSRFARFKRAVKGVGVGDDGPVRLGYSQHQQLPSLLHLHVDQGRGDRLRRRHQSL